MHQVVKIRNFAHPPLLSQLGPSKNFSPSGPRTILEGVVPINRFGWGLGSRCPLDVLPLVVAGSPKGTKAPVQEFKDSVPFHFRLKVEEVVGLVVQKDFERVGPQQVAPEMNSADVFELPGKLNPKVTRLVFEKK